MTLWPSKKQWKSWTLLSRLTFVGTYVTIAGIFLAISFFVINYLTRPDLAPIQSDIADIKSDLEDIVSKKAEEQETKLDKQYLTHTVFGVYQDRDIVPIGLMPENLEIDWDTGKVQSVNDNILMVTLPDMTLNGKLFVGGNVTFLEKRIGAKTKPIIIIGEFNPILEVIGIDGELVTVALGFPANDPKK